MLEKEFSKICLNYFDSFFFIYFMRPACIARALNVFIMSYPPKLVSYFLTREYEWGKKILHNYFFPRKKNDLKNNGWSIFEEVKFRTEV